MRHHDPSPSRFVEREGDAFAHAARADEHQRRAVRADRARRRGRRSRPTSRCSRRAPSSSLGTSTASSIARRCPTSTIVARRAQKCATSRSAARSPKGRCAAACGRFARDERVEPRQRQREVRAALVRGHRVNLVDDHRLARARTARATLGRQQNVERLGRRDEHVRRLAQHARALGRVVSPVRVAVRIGASDAALFGARAARRAASRGSCARRWSAL
jgi:hypothetical protein